MSCITGLHQLLYHILQLLAQEYGDDCGRCLVSAESVVVACCSYRKSEQICVFVNSLDDCDKECQELCVLHRRIAGVQKILTVIC